MKNILIVGSILFGLLSCSGNDENNPIAAESTNQNGTKMVRRVLHVKNYLNESYTMRFYYVGDKLYKITEADSNFSNNFSQVFSYTGNLITKIENFNFNNTRISQTLLVYDGAGALIHETRDDLADTEFNYTTNAGNIITRQAYGIYENQTYFGNKERFAFENEEVVNKWREVEDIDRDSIHETITYDTHNSPIKNIIGYDKVAYYHPWRDAFFFGVRQNVATSSSIIYFNGNQSEQNLIYAYTYNSYDYPMSCQLQYVDIVTGEIRDTPYLMEYYYE